MLTGYFDSFVYGKEILLIHHRSQGISLGLLSKFTVPHFISFPAFLSVFEYMFRFPGLNPHKKMSVICSHKSVSGISVLVKNIASRVNQFPQMFHQLGILILLAAPEQI